jgi:hypothetical protein
MQTNQRKVYYRVHAPITALKLSEGDYRIVTISRDSLITVIGTPKEFNLVDIECQGESMAVFSPSIEQRAAELREAAIQRS